MCGESISPSDVHRVKEQLDQVEVDLGVFTESHEQLSARLLQVLKEDNKKGFAQWQDDLNSFEEEEKKHVEELLKLRAKLIVLEGAISERGRHWFNVQDNIRLCNLEQRRLREELPRPTYGERKAVLDNRTAKLNQFNAQEEFKRLLNQNRDNQSTVEVID